MHLVPMTALVNKSGAKHNDDLSQEVFKDSREESDKTSICQNKLLVHYFTNSHTVDGRNPAPPGWLKPYK